MGFEMEAIEDWRAELRRSLVERMFPESVETQRAAFAWLAFEHEFEFMVTIQFGQALNDGQIHAAIGRFGALLDRYWLGRAWARYASDERAFFVATIERGKKGNSHVHMLLRRPHAVAARFTRAIWREELQAKVLSDVITDSARRKGICPFGDVLFERLFNQVGGAAYVLKKFGGRNSTELILSHEFHPRHSEPPVTATRTG
jgi:hypothetical protein